MATTLETFSCLTNKIQLYGTEWELFWFFVNIIYFSKNKAFSSKQDGFISVLVKINLYVTCKTDVIQ